MRAFKIVKEVCYDIGWIEPLPCTHKVGDLIIPSEDLYLSRDGQICNIASTTGRDMMPSANSGEGLGFNNGQEATNHILGIGRTQYGNDSFYREIEIDDRKIEEIKKMQKTIKDAPRDLTELATGVLANAS